MGVLAGTHVTGVYRRKKDSSSWDTLSGIQKVLRGGILALSTFKDSLLFGGESASVGQYRAHAEMCMPLTLDAESALVELGVIETGVIAIDTSVSSSKLKAFFLRETASSECVENDA